jgi:1,2-diacylglycerol 3-beta-glucosyltransferase
MNVLVTASALCALVVFPLALYLGVLALLARTGRTPKVTTPKTRFRIVVPAHDEEASIKDTVRGLLCLEWPEHLYDVVVVADNCTDRTAEVAAAAGAKVIVRQDPTKRGKGYALEHAFAQIVDDGETDAVVVVDADTIVSANLLKAFAARIEKGALACQAEYGVSNASASWRTELMTIALAMFHRLRSLARERLGVSAGLRGNGMCFTTRLLRKHPHDAYGLVEDVEYGVAIGMQGVRVCYAEEAFVLGEMVTTASAAASQRRRWEGGRDKLVKDKMPRLFKEAIAKNDGMLLDLAMDLAVPPLSKLTTVIALGLFFEWLLHRQTQDVSPGLPLWILSALCVAAYVLRGVQLSGLGARAFVVMAYAPVYIAWKVLLVLPLWRKGKKGEWVRTAREKERAA